MHINQAFLKEIHGFTDDFVISWDIVELVH